MARKKQTPSASDGAAVAETSKASAISDAVQGADFDTPDAAMADTSLEPKDVVEDEAPLVDVVTVHGVVSVDAEAVAEPGPELEPAVDIEPEPVVVAPPPPVKKGGFFGPLLGGALAAVIGFGGAIYFKAAEWPVFGAEATDPSVLIAEQSAQLAALAERLDGLSAQAQESQMQNADAFAALTARIDELPEVGATAPLSGEAQATLAAQKAEMEALQENLDKMNAMAQEQIAKAEAQQETAADAEARAIARGALNAVREALTTGEGFADALPDVAAATEVPDALAATANSGIASAAALEAEFGEAARAALSASLKETAGDAPADRIRFFLKDQLGARSLIPREGDDPDAVLSRAEAAVKAGDLDAALTTLEALPEAGRAALQDWMVMATTRRDAMAAFNSLADALSAN